MDRVEFQPKNYEKERILDWIEENHAESLNRDSFECGTYKYGSTSKIVDHFKLHENIDHSKENVSFRSEWKKDINHFNSVVKRIKRWVLNRGQKLFNLIVKCSQKIKKCLKKSKIDHKIKLSPWIFLLSRHIPHLSRRFTQPFDGFHQTLMILYFVFLHRKTYQFI